MFKPFLFKKAAKYYQGLDNNMAQRINKAIEKMVENPLQGPQIKKLKGQY
jgi:Txe/YoeB family toxin of Txe-Axe toxin-antitoxin module